jgi:hypothetical protein
MKQIAPILIAFALTSAQNLTRQSTVGAQNWKENGKPIQYVKGTRIHFM